MIWRELTGPAVQHRIGATLHPEGAGGYRILTEGWACRICLTPWGERQIVDVLLPGDPIGYAVSANMGSSCKVLALKAGSTVDATALADAVRADEPGLQGLRAACLAAERAEATRQRDHMVRLSAPTLYQALSHLLLALRRRLDAVGLVQGDRWPMELTQETLAEALGVGAAQVNRVLGRLRREKRVSTGRRWIETPDLDGLAQAAGGDEQRRLEAINLK